MTADVRPGTVAGATVARPSLGSRLFGLGSVFGKTLRDSRRAILIAGVLSGLLMLVTAAGLALEFDTAAERQLLVTQMRLLPIVVRGLLGEPIAIDTVGGFMSWRVGNTLPVVLGIWSVLSLSGTIAGEASKGSLDVLASTPLRRRRIAVEKFAAHVAAVAFAMVIAALFTSAAGRLGTLPGDEVSLAAALGQFVLTGLLMLVAGGAAFAVAPIVGRGRAAGIGFVVLMAGYVVTAYSSVVPLFDALDTISPFTWTAGHRPLADRTDWPAVGLLAAAVGGLLLAGVVAFERRDIGRTAELRWLRLPGLPAGTANPFVRSLADQAGGAIGWGMGIGAFGALIAASADAFATAIAAVPQMRDLIARIYPGVDILSASGVLQLSFFGFGALLVGLAAATFVGGWAGDETNRRLDLVLSTPLRRAPWALQSGLAVGAAIVLTLAVAAILIALAIAAEGGAVATPVIGLGVLVLYGAAVAGVGLAVGGLVRADLAAPVAGGVVIASYLLELIGTILRLPDWALSLGLNHHFGQPMAGTFDPFGLVLFAVLAAGGLGLGALGVRRRDLRG